MKETGLEHYSRKANSSEHSTDDEWEKQPGFSKLSQQGRFYTNRILTARGELT